MAADPADGRLSAWRLSIEDVEDEAHRRAGMTGRVVVFVRSGWGAIGLPFGPEARNLDGWSRPPTVGHLLGNERTRPGEGAGTHFISEGDSGRLRSDASVSRWSAGGQLVAATMAVARASADTGMC